MSYPWYPWFLSSWEVPVLTYPQISSLQSILHVHFLWLHYVGSCGNCDDSFVYYSLHGKLVGKQKTISQTLTYGSRFLDNNDRIVGPWLWILQLLEHLSYHYPVHAPHSCLRPWCWCMSRWVPFPRLCPHHPYQPVTVCLPPSSKHYIPFFLTVCGR